MGTRPILLVLCTIILVNQALPSKVTIDMPTKIEEGKEYTINCTVYEVAPLEYLTIYITRGGDIINNKSYEGPDVKDRQTVSHLYTFTARRRDNLMNFSCEAVLQLGSERHMAKSSEITVQTYTLPEAPVISVQEWIENGTIFIMECLVSNGFPPQDVRLNISIDDAPLDVIPVVTEEGTVKGRVRPTASYSLLGLKTIRCESYLFNLSNETTVNVYIYEPPAVSFSLSRNVTDLGENVTATCHITNKRPEPYGLSISVDGKEERREETSMLTHTFTASRRTLSLVVTCTAYIIENLGISRSLFQTLQIQYPPEFPESSCPLILPLVEGQTFSCQADGNPKPIVECGADGRYIKDRDIITRDMSGIYTCQATNQRGNVSKEINVTVQYKPMIPVLTVSTNAKITIGDPLNITCKSEGLPDPTYSWQIPNNAKVTYSADKSSVIIRTAAQTHSGTYICVARNQHGESSTKREVTVVSEMNIGLIIGVVICVVLTVAIVVAFWCILWKKERTESYEVTNLTQSQIPQNSGPTPESPANDASNV
ncbi:intercellular adhesion molecule 5-like isoform X2 [Hyla sarda]|uniref:intercellular adhesion molecule 5-like isoform X2 n=1 Tax=Hyla sarda TaxID=327740 RepID=UPI0024C3DFE1|nr:intercellular adhesion molecule 5-like isoform X2 [Hyla sarda]